MEIDISTPSGTESISVGVTVTPTAVTLAVPTVAGTIEKITINTGMASSDSQPEQVAEVAEAVAEVESAMEEEQSAESESEEKEDSKETKVSKAKAVQAIVNRVLQAVEMAGGDTDTTKLALMGMLGNQAFRSYQQQSIPDVAFYDTTVAYESPTYNDPLGDVFSLGSNQTMDAMRDIQYE
jgi:maltoporin